MNTISRYTPSLCPETYVTDIDALPKLLCDATKLIRKANAADLQDVLDHPELDMSTQSVNVEWQLACDHSYHRLWHFFEEKNPWFPLQDLSFASTVQYKLLGYSWRSVERAIRCTAEPHTSAAELVTSRFFLLCHWLHDNPPLLTTLAEARPNAWTYVVQRYAPAVCDESWPSYAALRAVAVKEIEKDLAEQEQGIQYALDAEKTPKQFFCHGTVTGRSDGDKPDPRNVTKIRGRTELTAFLDPVSFFDTASTGTKKAKRQRLEKSYQELKERTAEALPPGTVAKALQQECEVERKLKKVQFTHDEVMAEVPEREVEQLYDTLLRHYSAGIGTGKTSQQEKWNRLQREAAKKELGRSLDYSKFKVNPFGVPAEHNRGKVDLVSYVQSNIPGVSVRETRPDSTAEFFTAEELLYRYHRSSVHLDGKALPILGGYYTGAVVTHASVGKDPSAYYVSFILGGYCCPRCGKSQHVHMTWRPSSVSVSLYCTACAPVVARAEVKTRQHGIRFKDFEDMARWALNEAAAVWVAREMFPPVIKLEGDELKQAEAALAAEKKAKQKP